MVPGFGFRVVRVESAKVKVLGIHRVQGVVASSRPYACDTRTSYASKASLKKATATPPRPLYLLLVGRDDSGHPTRDCIHRSG